jgi:hypothetical protein
MQTPSQVSADYFHRKIRKKIKQYDKMITHTVQEQLKEQQNQNGIYSF